ncbi:MAG: DAK2 domain-containing protein [Thermoflexales bacterium]|nr:DAK2 domain-containing protein [Thermoflexales bacterium]MCX7938163.1 DAK2 domain-containing protein [Thermoflexales bacterium]MDW8396454.1 DAK2 domain-containing protein [Anaerolineae bacterium]
MGHIGAGHVRDALKRAAARMVALRDELNALDAAMGDGDTGLSVSKGGAALLEYVENTPLAEGEDIGKYLANAGMALNRAAPSTMGTLLATALMRMGREIKGATTLDAAALARMLEAAALGIQERGKAKLGDKTILDALIPASQAFSAALQSGATLEQAAQAMLAAARKGRDDAIPLRSNVGRASWVGERTEGKLDPGTVLCVALLEALSESA